MGVARWVTEYDPERIVWIDRRAAYPVWWVPRYPLARLDEYTGARVRTPQAMPFLRGLRRSIEKTGLRNPLLVKGTELQIGNNRLWCIQDLGWTHAPAIVTHSCDIEEPHHRIGYNEIQGYFAEGRIQVRKKNLLLRGIQRPEEEFASC